MATLTGGTYGSSNVIGYFTGRRGIRAGGTYGTSNVLGYFSGWVFTVRTGGTYAPMAYFSGALVPGTHTILGGTVYIDASTGSTSTVRYKNQGWYAAGGVFEVWISVNAPSTTPSSGHTLTDISHVKLQS